MAVGRGQLDRLFDDFIRHQYLTGSVGGQHRLHHCIERILRLKADAGMSGMAMRLSVTAVLSAKPPNGANTCG